MIPVRHPAPSLVRLLPLIRAAGFIRRSSFLLTAFLVLGLLPTARAQDSAAMPTEIFERLWQRPGPTQDEPGAPKLLLIYPKDGDQLPASQDLTRYAGRVDPPDAEVMLNGQPIRTYPGGTFTGLLKAPEGERTVTFSSTLNGKTTSITRTYRRASPIPPPRHRPMEFHREGWLRPWGEFWLRDGTQLDLKVLASPGNSVLYRIGDSGPWMPMQEVRATASEGGAYAATLTIDPSVPTEQTPLTFQLRPAASDSGLIEPITRNWGIQLRRLPPDVELTGVVDHYLTTFLKNRTGWDRWGNWPEGTPFPISERWDDRFRVDFGTEESGWIEVENTRLLTEREAPVRQQLALNEVVLESTGTGIEADRLVMGFDLTRPVAHVFYPEERLTGDDLTVSLVGGWGVENWRPLKAGPIVMSLERATENRPPRLKADLGGRPLWGYDFREERPGEVRMMVRAKPKLPADRPRPLEGLRIMVDAGHGGDDFGALGPSGLAEADVNLVVASFLGRRLRELGAEVEQLRTANFTVDLDDRVLRALAWEPDLFISVHHNSIGPSAHPLDHSGPIVFYHYPFQEALARGIAGELAEMWGNGASALVKKSVFRVNRNLSICPSVLIEGAFVSHPEDEYRLRQIDTLEAMAMAIARGIVGAVADK